jgi:orotate phosphoribosyltransferase
MNPTTRAKLLTLLTRGYAYKPGGFLLSAGTFSDEYLDCRLALSYPEAGEFLGDAFLSFINPNAVAIGGLTLGADPISINTSRSSATTSRPLRWFSVRKKPKDHGTGKRIEGAVFSGDFVTVVEDVVTTGKSTLEVIKACNDYGLEVIQVIALVDRDTGGLQRIQEYIGTQVLALFTKEEIRAEWSRVGLSPGT